MQSATYSSGSVRKGLLSRAKLLPVREAAISSKEVAADAQFIGGKQNGQRSKHVAILLHQQTLSAGRLHRTKRGGPHPDAK